MILQPRSALFIVLFFLCSCGRVADNGYVFNKKDDLSPLAGKRKSDVLRMLGSPSFVINHSTLGTGARGQIAATGVKESLYYSFRGKSYKAFFSPEITKNKTVRFDINHHGRISSVKEFNKANIVRAPLSPIRRPVLAKPPIK